MGFTGYALAGKAAGIGMDGFQREKTRGKMPKAG